MAFPRKKQPWQDLSSNILSTISETTIETLNADLASSWVAELDESIQAYRKLIHERIQRDASALQHQLASAKSVQTRLYSLENNVDNLSNALSNPETGLAPKLIRTLSEHATLAQTALNAEVDVQTLSHLQQCRTTFNAFSQLVTDGELPQAVKLSGGLESLLFEDAPPLFGEAEVFRGLKRQYRVIRDRAEEQLNEAYTRAVSVSPYCLIIRPSVRVRQSSTVLSLSSILASLSPNSLAEHLTTLRRDITTHYIDHVLSQPLSVATASGTDASGFSEDKAELFPAGQNSDAPISRIENLCVMLAFLHAHLFPTIPGSQRSNFLRLLSRPLTTGVLNHLLVPFLPSSLSLLPTYLELASRAVKFEEEDLAKFSGDIPGEKEIKSWTDGIVSHFEKKKRIDILERCRQMLMRDDDGSATFRAGVICKITSGEDKQYESGFDNAATEDPRSTSTLAENSTEGVGDVDEDSWGFEDEADPALEPPSEDVEEDAWDWNEGPSSTENGNIDDADEPSWDAWDEPLAAPVPDLKSPKPAKRLERLSSKKMQHSNDRLATSSASGAPPSAVMVPRKPPELRPIIAKEDVDTVEYYQVSVRVKEIVSMLEGVLQDAKEISSSTLFSSSSAQTTPGTLIFQTAPSILDLFRALCPFVISSDPSSPKKPIQFSNDCLYLSEEVGRINRLFSLDVTVKDKLDHCQDTLKVSGQSLFETAIDQQVGEIYSTLVQTKGFTDTGDQGSYDACESALNEVLQKIKRVCQQWKGMLTGHRYLVAAGSIVDATLVRVLEDITALPDIPAVESQRLSELCRILNALEGLFVEGPDQQSLVVAYVPSWLKFSYLSELLEASMADITYLFEEGALVDFDVDELVKLVRALFADTPLRTNLVNKIQQGHPVHE